MLSMSRFLATESKPSQHPTDAATSHSSDQQQHQEQPAGTYNTAADTASQQAPESSSQEARPLSEVELLTKQMAEKDDQLSELNNRTLRALAEMENVRMIARRDVDNAKKFAVIPFATAILSVADNLGLALNSVDKQQVDSDDANPLLRGLFVGVGATESELLKVFSQYGISQFGNVGDKFDPNKYQAMFEAPSAEHEPGTVINVQKLGYEMGERVLRPAEVGVSRAP